MSNTERWRGKLFPIDMSRGLEETCSLILSEEGIEVDHMCDTHADQLLEDLRGIYTILGGVVYRISKTEVEDSERLIMYRTHDEALEFDLEFYNGGCDFTEALEYAYKGMNNV